jgi:hypothetical protein
MKCFMTPLLHGLKNSDTLKILIRRLHRLNFKVKNTLSGYPFRLAAIKKYVFMRLTPLVPLSICGYRGGKKLMRMEFFPPPFSKREGVQGESL